MFTIKVDAFRTLEGDEKYEAKVTIGNQPVPYLASLTTDWWHEVEVFVKEHKEYLAGRGIAHVQMIENTYWASSTPDMHTYISDITEFAETGKKMKTWWVSAYTQRGNLFMETIIATDFRDMERKFMRANPDCDFADYGCWEDLEKGEE